MRHAITHIQALIDNQKTLIERGEALCLADPAYDHSKVSFWRQFEAQYVQLQKDMDGLNTEIEKKLAAIPIPGFYEPKTQSTREHPLV